MINPTQSDIGRKVIYMPHWTVRYGELLQQVGVITSFTENYIFVRYGNGSTSAATKREDLEWEVG